VIKTTTKHLGYIHVCGIFFFFIDFTIFFIVGDPIIGSSRLGYSNTCKVQCLTEYSIALTPTTLYPRFCTHKRWYVLRGRVPPLRAAVPKYAAPGRRGRQEGRCVSCCHLPPLLYFQSCTHNGGML
jgi:hypothetical protein